MPLPRSDDESFKVLDGLSDDALLPDVRVIIQLQEAELPAVDFGQQLEL